MSDLKRECPGCGSYSSSVGWAIEQGDPCPRCGFDLSNEPNLAERRFNELLREAKAEALEEAAASIPEQMRMDELGLHDLNYTGQLPQLSRVMLNGGTRFAERLVKRAAEYRSGTTAEGIER